MQFFVVRKVVYYALFLVIFFAVELLTPFRAVAQSAVELSNQDSIRIINYSVSPDADFSFKRVLSDSTLRFRPDSMRAVTSNIYWIKLNFQNSYSTTEHYVLSFARAVNSQLFQYSATEKRWVNSFSGPANSAQRRNIMATDVTFNPRSKNTLYLRVDLSDLKRWPYAVKPPLEFVKTVIVDTDDRLNAVVYYVCVLLLLSVLGYNLYIYVTLRDKAYLWYLIIQVGILMYITADKYYFEVLLPLRQYGVHVKPDGNILLFDFNRYLMHIGTVIMFCGFIQFTREYLNTKSTLPVYDKLLRGASLLYIVVDVIPATILVLNITYLYIMVVANICCLLIIILCLATGVAAYRLGMRPAKYFIAANLLPAVFAVSASIYIIIHKSGSILLPELGIISQMLTFAIALVARLKAIDNDLKARELEAVRLEADITVTEYKRRLIEQENENILLNMQLEKERNEDLQRKLEANQRELVGNSLYIHQKNKLLAELQEQIEDIDDLSFSEQPGVLKTLKSSLKDGQYLDDEWDKFKLHFEQVHPSFFKDMLARHPTLTKYELRLYAYFHINLSTKEIAALLNIAPASVRQAKTRLFKKVRS